MQSFFHHVQSEILARWWYHVPKASKLSIFLQLLQIRSWEELGSRQQRCENGFSSMVVPQIRRPESAWHGNILCRIQTMSSKASSKPKSKIQNPNSKIQNPKSKIQNPKSKIQTAPFGAATKRTNTKLIQNPKSKIQTPNSKIQSKLQTPKSKRPVWSLDFGLGRAGNGGDGYVANDDVWPCWPPEFGLVGGALACSRKVAGSIPPARGPNWAPISGGGVLPEIEPRFPAPRRGNRGPVSGETAGQAALLKTLGQHRAAPTMCVSARGCQHHVPSTICAYARDVNIA